MKSTLYKPLIFLVVIAVLPIFDQASVVHAQASNWCGSGTSSASDPLNSSKYPSIDMNPADYPSNIWVTDSLSKYLQNVDNTPTNTKWALPCAAKNEFADFQIHLKNTTGSSITLNSVIMSDLVNAQTGTHISASGGYGILVYAERYYNVHTLSDVNGIGTGPTPDPLVPTVEPYHGQTTNAFPITIANGNTQSIWIDVLVPQGIPSGYYSGIATVTVNGSTYATLPVVLAVWAFSLPSTATLTNEWGDGATSGDAACAGYYGRGSQNVGYAGCSAFPGAGGNSNTGVTLTLLDEGYILLDHRLSWDTIVYPSFPNAPSDSWTAFDATYGPLLNGTQTHTILPGAALTMITDNGPVSDADTQYWVTHFRANGWFNKIFDYAFDEPGTDSGKWANAAARAMIDDSSAPIMPVLITTFIAQATPFSALGYINYMVANVKDINNVDSGQGEQRSTYNTWLGGGSGSFSVRFGPYLQMYQSCTSHGVCVNYGGPGGSQYTYPSNMIDATAVRNRVMPWIEYLDNVSGDIYYDIDYCWYSPCDDGNHNTGAGNPWTYNYAFGGNGDGTLIYPGTSAYIGSGVSTPVPIGSVRLKLQRDGMQDYEYMAALANQGQTSFVTTQLNSFITNEYTFSNTNGIGCSSCLTAARNAMGNKLHQLNLGSPPPPAGLTAVAH